MATMMMITKEPQLPEWPSERNKIPNGVAIGGREREKEHLYTATGRCHTGNGEKLSSTQVELGQAINSNVAYFPFISCATSCPVALYNRPHSQRFCDVTVTVKFYCKCDVAKSF